MGDVTVAPQLTKNDSDIFLASFNANPTSTLDTRSDMESLLPSQGWPLEDLTGEVQELMLRESMNWLPWMEDANHSVKPDSHMENLDSQLLAQTLQLDGLFGQELNFDSFDQMGSSLLYDEFTFDNSPVSTPVPSQDQQQPHEDKQQQQQYHHNHDLPIIDEHVSSPTQVFMDTTIGEQDDASTDDDDDDDDDDSEGDSDDDEQQNGPISVLKSTYMYLPKRQLEETLLNKITHHLQPDKLPGILSIVSNDDEKQVNDEEVEIDLSSLVREQLVRVMLYVDACVAEQQGGSTVKLDHYLVNGGNKSIKEKTRTMTTDDGPISMAALTKKSRSTRKQQAKKASSTSKRRRTRRKSDQGMTSTRPTRRAALHKRRMLEDMLQLPSDNENDANDGLDQQVMVTFGEEQMDFKVVENQTIMHQSPSLPSTGGNICMETNMDDDDDDDDDDEEIDIM